MAVIREQDVVEHRMHGATFHSYVAPSRGSRELSAWRLEIADGTVGVPHRVSREEVLFLLSGAVTTTIDGETATVRAGEAAFVPAGAQFAIDNTSGELATAWVTTSAGLRATLADGTELSPPWAA
ncbi:cupin domain-containing protein [Couchioplanes caeruleus]|uniref:Cupin n=2 Tax=Couchioplanes caeruleus TaxID=56438 RepID=A0A1K0FL84_9ACTN|nr:cupin domain-containing protein [Couchioplanes caeruleus]OJF13607.1 cupin [Couchioplanes caeruleus subsp. caeruleus]ROP33099.1 mannose-6-phosphate isomerase-like protein (cupin superfamily) [Couchioplanes caeruleus]